MVQRRFPAIVVAVVVAVLVAGRSRAADPPDGPVTNCTTVGCHDGYGRQATVHPPVASGSCDACHEQKRKTGHLFQLTLPKKELCLDCHEEMTEDRSFLHGPVAAGQCTSCHNPHASESPSLLLATGTALCLRCHDSIARRLKDSPFSHQPAREDCTSCHDVHGSDHRMNLLQEVPALCLDCHDDMADRLDEAPVEHPAVTIGKSCLNCHDPHAASQDHGLREEPMTLCLTCHSKPIQGKKRQVANIGEQLASRSHHHGPIVQKDCTSCHTPHSGARPRLLAQPYPAGFYAPFEEDRYALCFDCHDVELVEEEQTDEATGFRNGERNLHFVHVHRDVKGRTCRACHEPHASANPKMIATTVPFGKWSLPIGFQKTETGGSCAPGCHVPRRYDREKPVASPLQLPP